MLGRGIAHLTIYLPALALYLIVLPRIYGFSTLGDPLQLLALGSVFLLATSFMGQAVGAWFTRPENATLIFLATSLPQFFPRGSPGRAKRSPRRRSSPAMFPGRLRDQRHRPHQPAGREHLGGGADWRGLGSWPSFISRWPWFRLMSSSGGGASAWQAQVHRHRLRRSLLLVAGVLISCGDPSAAAPIVGVVRTTEIRVAPEVAASLSPSRSRRARACAQAMSSPSCLRSS